MLGTDYEPEYRSLLRTRNQLLKHNTPQTVQGLNSNPVDFLFPYIRNSARNLAYSLKLDRGSAYRRKHNWRTRNALSVSMKSLAKFVSTPELSSDASTLRLSALLTEYATLIQESEAMDQEMQADLQQQANEGAIEEARKGTTQGESVRRKVNHHPLPRIEFSSLTTLQTNLSCVRLHSSQLRHILLRHEFPSARKRETEHRLLFCSCCIGWRIGNRHILRAKASREGLVESEIPV